MTWSIKIIIHLESPGRNCCAQQNKKIEGHKIKPPLKPQNFFVSLRFAWASDDALLNLSFFMARWLIFPIILGKHLHRFSLTRPTRTRPDVFFIVGGGHESDCKHTWGGNSNDGTAIVYMSACCNHTIEYTVTCNTFCTCSSKNHEGVVRKLCKIHVHMRTLNSKKLPIYTLKYSRKPLRNTNSCLPSRSHR